MKKFDSFDKLAEFVEGERLLVISEDQLAFLIEDMTPELAEGVSYCYDKNAILQNKFNGEKNDNRVSRNEFI